MIFPRFAGFATHRCSLFLLTQSLNRGRTSCRASRCLSTSSATIPAATRDEEGISVGWDQDMSSRFHHVWLRENCRCGRCFHAVTKQRLLDPFTDVHDQIRPSAVEATKDGLAVTWNEGAPHPSLYPWHWLKAHSYNPPLPLQSQTMPKVLWGANIAQHPPTVRYSDVIESERGVWLWLRTIDTYGFSFVEGVPPTPEATEALSERIGIIRETQYGKFWDFTSDLAKGDTAYTEIALGAHTDNTYFTDPSALQLFHLLQPADQGGSTLLVDGFRAASLLRNLHPEHHATLARTPIQAHAAGEKGRLFIPELGWPVLTYDKASEREFDKLVQVRWNPSDRSALRVRDPIQWYAAAREYEKILRAEESEFWVHLGPGTAVVVDNHRVLHGRSAFSRGKRRMCGAYIATDEYRGRLAALDATFLRSEDQQGVWSSDY